VKHRPNINSWRPREQCPQDECQRLHELLCEKDETVRALTQRLDDMHAHSLQEQSRLQRKIDQLRGMQRAASTLGGLVLKVERRAGTHDSKQALREAIAIEQAIIVAESDSQRSENDCPALVGSCRLQTASQRDHPPVIGLHAHAATATSTSGNGDGESGDTATMTSVREDVVAHGMALCDSDQTKRNGLIRNAKRPGTAPTRESAPAASITLAARPMSARQVRFDS